MKRLRRGLANELTRMQAHERRDWRRKSRVACCAKPSMTRVMTSRRRLVSSQRAFDRYPHVYVRSWPGSSTASPLIFRATGHAMITAPCTRPSIQRQARPFISPGFIRRSTGLNGSIRSSSTGFFLPKTRPLQVLISSDLMGSIPTWT